MPGLIQQARDAIAHKLEQFRNREFLEATMAASALVATADGRVDIAELNMIDQALEKVHELNIYDPHVAVDFYRDHMEALRTEPDARDRILEQVGRLRDDPEACEMLLKVCVAIAKSDDTVTQTERGAIAALCDAMGVPRDKMRL